MAADNGTVVNPLECADAGINWTSPVYVKLSSFVMTEVNGNPLTKETQYLVRVTASNDPSLQLPAFCASNEGICKLSGDSVPSDFVVATTKAPTPAKSPPPPLFVSATGGSMTVNWTAPSDRGGVPVQYYIINVQLDADGSTKTTAEAEAAFDEVSTSLVIAHLVMFY
jgi:hypothetical protein